LPDLSDRAIGTLGLLIGIAGILIGAAVSYYFYRKGRERVDPCYLLQHSPILGESRSAMRDVTVMYKGREITNLNRCLLILWNRGSRPLLRGSVVNKDPIRVVLPDGAKALDVGLVEISRPVTGLNASIDGMERSILIDLDFLDKGDGGVIEILYQGSETLTPLVAGSIIGVPKGLRRPNTRGVSWEYDDTDDEESRGFWERQGGNVLLVSLLVFTVASAVVLGPGSPLSVMLMTLSGLVALATLTAALQYISFRRAVGPLDDISSWHNPTKDGAER
jgi:hypothetical protein